MTPDRKLEWDWYPGTVPANVVLEEEAYLETSYSFQLFRSEEPAAVRIGRGASVYLGVMFDLGRQATVRIGQFALLNGARIICDSSITIGDYCLISWNVVLMDTVRLPRAVAPRRRELERVPKREPRQARSRQQGRPICIEPNVWVGFDVCVLPGVRIGEGSVIGARSVVVENVPPYSVAVGNPARIVRTLEPGKPRKD